MKQQSIENHLNDYFDSQQLTESKMTFLLEQESLYRELVEVNAVEKNKRSRVKKRFDHVHLSWVASFFIVIATIFFIAQPNVYFSLEERIADEILMNHVKNLPSDFENMDLVMLGKNMPKLGFELIDSSKIRTDHLVLVGARYCSIQGNIAAQLKYRSPNNKRVTVYQTLLNNKLYKVSSKTIQMEEAKVQLWQEQDRLFGLAIEN